MLSSFKLPKKPYVYIALIAIVSIVMHHRIFTLDLQGVHVWRQTETEINIQNFYRHDNDILNPRHNNFSWENHNILRLEFPIMQWTIAQIERIFGESITVTRVSIFIIGILSVFGFFQLFQLLFKNPLLSFLATWCFNFSPVFYYYTLNPIPDNLALCGAIWSWVYFYKFIKNYVWQYAFISAAFLCLATLAKLPFIIFGGVYFLFVLTNLIRGRINFSFILKLSSIFIAMLIPAIAWYAWVMPEWGDQNVITGIFQSKLSKEDTYKYLRYHRDVMFPNLLLNRGSVVFFVIGITTLLIEGRLFKPKYFELTFGSIFVFAYFYFELNIILDIHDYYMMPFLPFLFIAVGYGIKQLLEHRILYPFVIFYTLTMLPYFAYKDVQSYWWIGTADAYWKDLYQFRDDFRRAAPNDAKCIILSDESTYVFSYLIDKQGFIFNTNNLDPGWVSDMIDNKDATYMYSNNRKVDENPEISKFFETLVLQHGIVKVFKLKPSHTVGNK